MKNFLALTMILGCQLAYAAPMDEQIRSLARRITNNSQMAERLSQDEKIQVLKALNNADAILGRVGTDYGNGGRPGRDPWPTNPYPTNPYPTYPPTYPAPACEREQTSVYQSAFTKIKTLAFSPSGFNYDSASATNFAQNWTRNNPCSYADLYVKNANLLRQFAYSTSGLDYSSVDSANFAIQNTDKFCSNFPLQQEFTAAYNFAYSRNGMDMSSADAKVYALEQVKFNAFSCRNN